MRFKKMVSQTLSLRVTGMHCGGCEGKLRRALESLKGVKDVVVDRSSESVTLTSDALAVVQIIEVITDVGFSASLAEGR